MGDRDLVTLVAGRAIGDLDPQEETRLEPHLAACRPCREIAWELDETLADLALAAPYRRPPAALRDSVMAAVAGRPLTVLPGTSETRGLAGPHVMAGWWRRLDLSRLLPLGLAAAISLAAIGGLAYQTVQLRSQLDDATSRVASMQQQLGDQAGMLSVAMDPSRRSATLEAEALAPAAAASVVFLPGTDRAYLVADRLPPTAPGTSYQLWYADRAGVHAGRVFAWDGHGTAVIPFGVDLSGKAAAMVTLEPAGGSTGAPGPEVVFGAIPSA